LPGTQKHRSLHFEPVNRQLRNLGSYEITKGARLRHNHIAEPMTSP
jgi:hypothetical protein